MIRFVLSLSLAILIFGGITPLAGLGCEFFSDESGSFYKSSLREKITSSDSIMVAKWFRASPAALKAGANEKANFTVVEVIKSSKQEFEQIKVGKVLTTAEYRPNREWERFLVLGYAPSNSEGYRYLTPRLVLTDALIEYVRRSPDVDVQPEDQLVYFAGHLESSDPIVAQDAFQEFVNSIEFEHLFSIQNRIPLEKLRQWLTDPQTAETRIGAFGLLLGCAGDEADIPLLREISLRKIDAYRSGADGLFSGYLMLAGEKGLETLEDAKLRDKSTPFSDTYATLQAVRFMLANGEGRISKDRLLQTLHLFLDRPELADLVIIDLGRWQDWSVSDKLMELYGKAGYDIPSTKRAIVRFFLTAEATKPKDAKEPLPEHVVTAQKHLKALREKDPETVKAAEEFFFLNF